MTLESGDSLFVAAADRCLRIVTVSSKAGRGEAAFTPEEAMSWLEDLAGRSQKNHRVLLMAGGVCAILTQFEVRMLVKCVENQAHKLFFL